MKQGNSPTSSAMISGVDSDAESVQKSKNLLSVPPKREKSQFSKDTASP
jgi:hypothetical protein